jgi:hypothetical protein
MPTAVLDLRGGHDVICLIEKAKGAAILTELDETQKLFAID